MAEDHVTEAVARIHEETESKTTSTEAKSSLDETIEERCFSAALICLEGHFTQSPPMGPQTAMKVNSIVSKTLEKTHTIRQAREAMSRNVAIWIWLTRIFAASIPTLTARSVGPLSSLSDPEKGVSPQESTALIVMNHASIKEDLGTLIKLMHIARNLLVNAEPEVPQDICAAVHFDQMVYQTIILCVNVTSKGYDGEILDETQRLKLADITELYKKLLVTALQQAHNWTAKHDRNKMSFWFDVLFDDEDGLIEPDHLLTDCSGFRPELAKQQVQHWLDRNSRMCDKARQLLRDYTVNHADKPPGNLAPIRPLAKNWLPEEPADTASAANDEEEKINPVWKPNETNRFEQDLAYGRVSREVDTWWLRARDPNYEEWTISMPTVEFAQSRLEHCKTNLIHRFGPLYRDDLSLPPDQVTEVSDTDHCPDCGRCHHDEPNDSELDHDHDHEHDHEHDHHHGHKHHHDHDHEHHDHDHDHDHDEHDESCEHHHHCHHCEHDHDYPHDYMDDMLDDDDIDDDESYGDGPLTGLLTEVPNILDPKQIEALHMIVKSCILDNSGSGLTKAGENLQKTRCRMLLATDCGKSLLRELLVFIAVWDKDEQSLIFQVTTQIVEALHHSALIPYAWNSLRIPKDIISPAQTVLLRLVSHMLRARHNNNNNATGSNATANAGTNNQDPKENSRDVKLVHFFYSFFRNRVAPECTALMHLQAEIRQEKCDAADFPVDSWDMERAKEGMAQYLDFLTAVAEMPETRAKLIEWESVYDLITILGGLESGVAKKPLVEMPNKTAAGEASDTKTERPFAGKDDNSAHLSPPPPVQDAAHTFPWSGIKGQIFTIVATLLQPPAGQSSPGNADVQEQMVKHNGIVPLLNCCAYDDHNPFAKERVTICLKWLLDGCEAANNFFRELVSMGPKPDLKPPPGGNVVSTLRVDGIGGDVKVRVQSKTGAPVGAEEPIDPDDFLERAAGLRLGSSNKEETGNIEDDFMA